MVLGKAALAVPQQDIALADPRISNYDDLLQEIKLLGLLLFRTIFMFHRLQSNHFIIIPPGPTNACIREYNQKVSSLMIFLA